MKELIYFSEEVPFKFNFQTGVPDTTKVSRQHGHFYRGCYVRNVYHIKQATKQDKKSITSFKEKIQNRSPILE